MKLQLEYPNYKSALMALIGDKNPKMISNDGKLLSYYLPLRNFKNGCDYFELARHNNIGVNFRMVTMLGLRTIVKTESQIIYTDKNIDYWIDIIHQTKMSHFLKDEYQALKSGYVKKKGSGCFGMLIIILLFIGTYYVI